MGPRRRMRTCCRVRPARRREIRLPRLIGLGNAKDLILTGRTIDADGAMRMGLVNRVVDDGEVLHTATDLAREIAANAPLALRFAKMALNASAETSTRAGMYLEATAQAVTFEDEEKYKRMTAFLK